jgi:hypothetical protein
MPLVFGFDGGDLWLDLAYLALNDLVMSNDNKCNSSIDRFVWAMEGLKHALEAAQEVLRQCATKQDLLEMEARLVNEIKASNQGVDLTGLAALLERTHGMLEKLHSVEAPKTP